MSGYTPGPWAIVPYGDGDSLVICAPDADWRICFMATPGDSPRAASVIEANAKLIAAAPELLEALAQLLAITDDPDNHADEDESVFPFARAVISKALGSPPETLRRGEPI